MGIAIREHTEHAHSVVGGNDNDILVGSKATSVIRFLTSVTKLKSTTVDPEHHGTTSQGCWSSGSVDTSLEVSAARVSVALRGGRGHT